MPKLRILRKFLSKEPVGSALVVVDIAAVSNYVTARFGAKGATLTGKDVADLRNQASQKKAATKEAPNG